MAKNRFATKALNKKDESILVTMELNVSTMDIEMKHFIIGTMSDNDLDQYLQKWSSGEEVSFPDTTITESRSFTEESLLPDHIKVDGKSGAIRQLQNEWSYLLLNAKLFEQFNTELDMIKQKTAEVKNFSHELFDEAKEFWEKVLEYKKEREISQEKLNHFKEEINGVFDHLKNLKESMMKEKDEVSEKVKEEITGVLATIDSKMDQTGAHFKTIMEELKEVQAKLRSHDIKRDVKNILFDNIQTSFEKLKAKREETFGGSNNARVEGLQKVLDRILHTLNLDKKDLDFNTKKLNSVNNKLELQLREAKINVLNDRISSKEEKVADIQKTLAKLTSKKSNPKEESKGLMENLSDSVAEKLKQAKESIETATEDIQEQVAKKTKKVKRKY